LLRDLKRVHFIGIGGSGMSGIALVAQAAGIQVSGSDLKQSEYMQALLRAGLDISVPHNAANVADPDIEVVVVSTAIPDDNPELVAARQRGLTFWPRARMLAYLGRQRQTLAVAGTHGKTTTSAMLASALVHLGADPTLLIGGVVEEFDSTAKVGDGSYFVVEADESDGSFVWLDPSVAIITNIEADHMDHYKSIDEVHVAFTAFLAKLDPAGVAVVCADSPELLSLAEKTGHDLLTYGLAADAQVRCEPGGGGADAGGIAGVAGGRNAEDGSSFAVAFPDGQRVSLRLEHSPGLHNMVNATAVMATLDYLGFEREAAARAVSGFRGVHRRFQIKGVAKGVTVVDDYGHHPTEVAATLKAASELGYNRVHVLFQPHRYTRTQAFVEEFGAAFDHADTITLMEIYSAGEEPIAGIDSALLLAAVQAHDPQANIRLLSQRFEVAAAMAAAAAPGDLIITMGAGDVTNLGPEILQILNTDQGGDAQQ
jgi:UDP-N-acetylmuramate--alanine ligase